MSDINKEMQAFARRVVEEATVKGYLLSICLADGNGHGEFHHNVEEIDYSMIKMKGERIHVKIYMKSEKEKTEKFVNALIVMTDIAKYNALNYLELTKSIKRHLEVEETGAEVIPFKADE